MFMRDCIFYLYLFYVMFFLMTTVMWCAFCVACVDLTSNN